MRSHVERMLEGQTLKVELERDRSKKEDDEIDASESLSQPKRNSRYESII